MWNNSLSDHAPLSDDSDLEEQSSKQHSRGKRFTWTPALVHVLETLVPNYPSLKAFKGENRLEIFRRAIESYNQGQVSLCI